MAQQNPQRPDPVQVVTDTFLNRIVSLLASQGQQAAQTQPAQPAPQAGGTPVTAPAPVAPKDPQVAFEGWLDADFGALTSAEDQDAFDEANSEHDARRGAVLSRLDESKRDRERTRYRTAEIAERERIAHDGRMRRVRETRRLRRLAERLARAGALVPGNDPEVQRIICELRNAGVI